MIDTAITKLSNLMISGKVNEDNIPITYGANLCAPAKKDGDFNPIAVDCSLVRSTTKFACRSEHGYMSGGSIEVVTFTISVLLTMLL